jgi:hypothetical protein
VRHATGCVETTTDDGAGVESENPNKKSTLQKALIEIVG